MRFSVYQVSRKGGREVNQDRMGYCYSREAALFVVADGMGGHPEGDVAAEIAMSTLAARFQREVKPVVPDVPEFLRLSILIAHQQIMRYAAQKGMIDTPRTTIVVCMIQKGTAWWAHVGDSRLYFVRKGALLSRTRDHSHVEAAKAQGPEAVVQTVNRNMLYSCLGSPQAPQIEMSGPIHMEQGDTVMLCSDGLWGPIADSVILQSLASRAVVDAVPQLVEHALKTAGERADNTTALAFEWEGYQDFEDTRGGRSSGGFSTLAMSEDSFASTIAASAIEEPYDTLLDDDAIERTIAEIREVIERSGKAAGKPGAKPLPPAAAPRRKP
jgi:serine/threonine protein phosphatase PrpC